MSRNRRGLYITDRHIMAERRESVTVDLLSPGKGFGVCVKLRENKGKLEITVFTGLHHTLSEWAETEFSVDLPNDADAPNDEEEGNDDEGEDEGDDEEGANPKPFGKPPISEIIPDWDKDIDEEDDEGDDEAATLAGMEGGAIGYNEARGYDTEEPEPCGHHCDYDCPRCGV